MKEYISESIWAIACAAVLIVLLVLFFDFQSDARHEEKLTERSRLEACGTIDNSELRVLCISGFER